jgi:ABC-type nitrate/sulfonate/bicarbonate transport system permease component
MKITAAAGAAVALGAWWAASALSPYPPALLPSPLEVAVFAATSDGWQILTLDFSASVGRLVAGFLVGAVAGVALGVVLGRSQALYTASEFVLDFLRSLPVAALIPLFLVLLGPGEGVRVASAAWATALIVVVGTTYGVRALSPTRQRFLKTLRAPRRYALVAVILPGALPAIIASLRTGASITVIVVVLSEMLVVPEFGLGSRILHSSQEFEGAAMFFALGLSGCLGYGVNRLLVVASERALKRIGF